MRTSATGARYPQKSHRHLFASSAMKFQFMAEHQRDYPVTTMCRALEVSVSGYCYSRQGNCSPCHCSRTVRESLPSHGSSVYVQLRLIPTAFRLTIRAISSAVFSSWQCLWYTHLLLISSFPPRAVGMEWSVSSRSPSLRYSPHRGHSPFGCSKVSLSRFPSRGDPLISYTSREDFHHTDSLFPSLW